MDFDRQQHSSSQGPKSRQALQTVFVSFGFDNRPLCISPFLRHHVVVVPVRVKIAFLAIILLDFHACSSRHSGTHRPSWFANTCLSFTLWRTLIGGAQRVE